MERVRVKGLGGEAGPDIRPDNKECLYDPNNGDDNGDVHVEPSSEVRLETFLRRREDADAERESEVEVVADEGTLSPASSDGGVNGVSLNDSMFNSRARGLGSSE
jgi:hypothetical protein